MFVVVASAGVCVRACVCVCVCACVSSHLILQAQAKSTLTRDSLKYNSMAGVLTFLALLVQNYLLYRHKSTH